MARLGIRTLCDRNLFSWRNISWSLFIVIDGGSSNLTKTNVFPEIFTVRIPVAYFFAVEASESELFHNTFSVTFVIVEGSLLGRRFLGAWVVVLISSMAVGQLIVIAVATFNCINRHFHIRWNCPQKECCCQALGAFTEGRLDDSCHLAKRWWIWHVVKRLRYGILKVLCVSSRWSLHNGLDEKATELVDCEFGVLYVRHDGAESCKPRFTKLMETMPSIFLTSISLCHLPNSWHFNQISSSFEKESSCDSMDSKASSSVLHIRAATALFLSRSSPRNLSCLLLRNDFSRTKVCCSVLLITDSHLT